jgi:predicted transposase/invertase (TIGR01784 family)
MKHDNVPETFHSPYMSQVADKLSILKMSKDERADYTYYMKKLYNDRDELQAAESRGIEKGMAEGKSQKARKVALELLKENLSIDLIERATGLSREDIQALKI